jgi:hypothetical protein
VLLFAGGRSDTTVSSILIGQQIETGNETGASAISIVLLLLALACLLIITLIQRWGSRHERAQGAGAGVGIKGNMSGLPFDPGVSSLGETADGNRKHEEDDNRE